MIVITHNSHATSDLGETLSLKRKVLPGQVLALHGDLGTGKTVFCRGFAKGLGITEPVTSPTFNIVQEYPLPDGNSLFHLDLYRINNDSEAIAFGIDEYLFNPKAYTLIEWPERIPGLLGNRAVDIVFEHLSADQRIITFPDSLTPLGIGFKFGWGVSLLKRRED